MKYSFSKLHDYSCCPFYFKCRHIDKVVVEEQEILVKGSVIHAILAEYTLACYKSGKTQLFDEWESIAVKVIADMNVLPEYEAEIMLDVKAYVEANEIELEGLAGVEERIAVDRDFNVKEWRSDDVWFRAIFDKLYLSDNMGKISDYKTGYSMSPDTFQLEIYAWLAYKIYPQLEFVQVEYDFTRFSYKKLFAIGKEAIPQIQRKVMNRIRVIENDKEFNPKIGTLCGRCPFWDRCPSMKKATELNCAPIVIPKTKATAKSFLENYLARERVVDEMKKVLKNYCEESGAIISNDVIASIKPISSKEWDVSKVLEWGQQTGTDLSKILNVDSGKAKKLKLPEDFFSMKIGTRFTIGQVKKEKEKDLDNEK